MTDIVERLRIGGRRDDREAAAEIERLRQQLWLVREDLAHLIAQMDSWSGKGAQK